MRALVPSTERRHRGRILGVVAVASVGIALVVAGAEVALFAGGATLLWKAAVAAAGVIGIGVAIAAGSVEAPMSVSRDAVDSSQANDTVDGREA